MSDIPFTADELRRMLNEQDAEIARLRAEVERLNNESARYKAANDRMGTSNATLRAALVEKARTYLGLDMPTPNIAAAIDLIRAEVLEEAAWAYEAEADKWKAWPQAGAAKRKGAAAIRALKGGT